MASPDATPYIDLRLLDVSTQDLFTGALENLLSYWPEWVPREAHMEVLLLEAFGIEITEGVFAINRLPGALVEAQLALFGITRDLGAPPSGTFRFTASDTAGHIVPAGTRIGVPVDLSTGEVLVFSTVEALLIPAGQLVGSVIATASTNTTDGNGTAPGAYVELIDSVSIVERIDLVSFISGGADVEDDLTWFTRGVQRFARLSETLVLPRHFTSAALELTSVSRAFTIDNFDPASGQQPGQDAGHVTVAVYGDGGPLSTADKNTLRLVLDAAAQANLAVHVVDPTINPVDVTTQIVVKAGYTEFDTRARVAAALRTYLSPEQWAWGTTVYYNEVIALIDGVLGVERVGGLQLNGQATNVVLTGVAPLARADDLVVNGNSV